MAPLKVNQYEDFVLKLKIKAADGTSQIRRVRLPRIADAIGNVSYEELVGLVVTFTFPAESSPENSDFDCTLTYFDEDEDTVTIASTAELVDAVEQFVDKKVLRISTEVKRKTSSTASTPATTTQTPQTSNGTTDRGTSTKPDNLEANLQNVLESFASVLVTAVSSLEKGLAATPANGAGNVAEANVSTGSAEDQAQAAEEPAAKPAAAKPTEEPATERAEESSASAPPATSQKPVAKDKAAPYIHRRHTCDSCLMNPIVGARYHAVNMMDYDLCENCYPNYSGKETEFVSYPTGDRVNRKQPVLSDPPCQGFSAHTERTPVAPTMETKPAPQETAAPEPASSNESAPAPTPTQNDLPFIHGRHTCDSCLMNPIIGKRFHSKNLKDYDLCENCHSCYEGTEIQFEAVELARDRAFQKRWNRRRQRIEKMNRKRPGRFGRGRRVPDFAECPNRTEPSSEAAPAPSAPAQESTARVIPIQPSDPPPSATEDFDGALKEAIRRSLEDVMPKEIQEIFEPTEPIIAPSAPTEEEVRGVDENMCDATDVVVDAATTTSAPESEVVDAAAIAEEESRASSSMVEVDEQRLLDSMVEDTLSVDSEEMACADDSKPAAVDRETSMSTPERRAPTEQSNSPGTTTDDSFALDAVGNGDAAEAMGATLDILAGVISEMLTEADAHNSPAAILDEVIDSAVEESDLEVVEPEAAPEVQDEAAPAEEADTTAGALIMGSEEGTEDPREEVDGWQVVEENPNESSDIANATQMLGSVLFTSDMRSSETMESGNSVVLSTASSVPSDLPSVSVLTEASGVTDMQRNRWASQLYMMREMGFDDEAHCVDTLERLQAANIGCGEEEEVSVTQAVEAMLAELK